MFQKHFNKISTLSRTVTAVLKSECTGSWIGSSEMLCLSCQETLNCVPCVPTKSSRPLLLKMLIRKMPCSSYLSGGEATWSSTASVKHYKSQMVWLSYEMPMYTVAYGLRTSVGIQWAEKPRIKVCQSQDLFCQWVSYLQMLHRFISAPQTESCWQNQKQLAMLAY